MKMDMSKPTPANSALVGGIALAAMTADQGNPLINAAVGAGVGAAVGVGARVKQSMEKRRHSVTSDTQLGKYGEK